MSHTLIESWPVEYKGERVWVVRADDYTTLNASMLARIMELEEQIAILRGERTANDEDWSDD